MGVTLHYAGKLKSPNLIHEIKDELIEICTTNEWTYTIIEDDKMDPSEEPPFLNGIIFYHEESEPISMTFNEHGELVPILLKAIEIPRIDGVTYASTKTQYAGPDFHIKLCNLFHYLSSRYFQDWICKDDSKYYETKDRARLEKCMHTVDKAITALEEAIEAHGEMIDKSSPEQLKDFIQNVLSSEEIEVKTIFLDDEEE